MVDAPSGLDRDSCLVNWWLFLTQASPAVEDDKPRRLEEGAPRESRRRFVESGASSKVCALPTRAAPSLARKVDRGEREGLGGEEARVSLMILLD